MASHATRFLKRSAVKGLRGADDAREMLNRIELSLLTTPPAILAVIPYAEKENVAPATITLENIF